MLRKSYSLTCYRENLQYLRALCRQAERLQSLEDRNAVYDYISNLADKREKEAQIKALEAQIQELKGE